MLKSSISWQYSHQEVKICIIRYFDKNFPQNQLSLMLYKKDYG